MTENREITYSSIALAVYAVSCVFFVFLVGFLYIVGLTPMRGCFRYCSTLPGLTSGSRE